MAFGIKTDTLGFSRTFNPVDIRALSWLNAWVDPELMKSIESPPRSRDTLQSFVSAFTNMKEIQGVLLVPINELSNRDALAQIADFLMSTEEIDTVIAYGQEMVKSFFRQEQNRRHNILVVFWEADGQMVGQEAQKLCRWTNTIF